MKVFSLCSLTPYFMSIFWYFGFSFCFWFLFFWRIWTRWDQVISSLTIMNSWLSIMMPISSSCFFSIALIIWVNTIWLVIRVICILFRHIFKILFFLRSILKILVLILNTILFVVIRRTPCTFGNLGIKLSNVIRANLATYNWSSFGIFINDFAVFV